MLSNRLLAGDDGPACLWCQPNPDGPNPLLPQAQAAHWAGSKQRYPAASMDLSGLIAHSQSPSIVTEHAVVLPGPHTPLVLPVECLPPGLRARWLLDHPMSSPAQRVDAALTLGDTARAWAIICGQSEAILLDRRFEIPVQAWISGELQRIGCPLHLEAVRKDQAVWQSVDEAITLGLRDTRTVLTALAWPRWIGPVLLVPAEDPLLGGAAALHRPALPILVLPTGTAGERRAAIAASASDLALDLSAAPATGWPTWVRIGTRRVCAAVARGEGPSPRAMHAIRQAAGAHGIASLFTAANPDADLAQAVCAYLLHSSRRHRFAHLLDPLRHGSDAATALRIGYGISPVDLVEQR